jgi:hypothetical protein
MTTFSFDYAHCATESEDGFDPATIYTITLYGDAGPATRFETRTILDNTPRALLKLRTDRLPQGEKFVVDKTKGYFDHLPSEHYTWRVARKDGKPIHLAELQFAFLLKATKQNKEPIFSIPLSTLRALLTAPEPLTHYLVDALSDAEPGQGGVHIPDLEVAAGLLELGVICVTSTRHMYALMDIAIVG